MAFEPSENPITNPTRESYTELRPFRFWCQKVLPLVYDDSLSYYELLCKVVDYLNKTMEDVDHMNTDMDTLYSNFQTFQEGTFRIYNELVDYVNTYFDELDVQEEINNKLDEMVSSGELVTILRPTIANEVSDWLSEHITPTTPIIDDTLTIEGAGADAKVVGQAINNINTEVTNIKNDLNNFTGYKNNLFDSESAVDNQRINSSGGSQIHNGYYTSDYISVEGNMAYIVNMSTIDDFHRIAIYDSSKQWINGELFSTRVFVTPSNGAYIRFCGLMSEKDTTVCYKILGEDSVARETIDNTIDSLYDNTNLFDINTATDGGRLNTSGNFQIDANYYTSDYIPVIPNVSYRKNSPVIDSYHRICVYNESKTFIPNEIYNDNEITIPENGAFVRFCGLLTEKNEANLLAVTAKDDIARYDISNLKKEINETFDSVNLFDETYAENNTRLNASGNTQEHNGYYTSDYIIVYPNVSYQKNSPVIDAYHRICIYDESKVLIPNAVYNDNIVTIPDGGSYVRFCGLMAEESEAKFNALSAYDGIARGQISEIRPSVKQVINLLGGYGITDKYASVSGEETISVANFPRWIKKNTSVSFYGKFSSFTVLKVGVGYNDYRGDWVEITATQVIFHHYEDSDTVVKTVDHGLTISNYIMVLLYLDENGYINCFVNTITGTFKTSRDTNFNVFSGAPFAIPTNNMTNVEISVSNGDLNKPLWVIGDSYVGVTSDRVMGQLRELGFWNGIMIDGLAGLNSTRAYQELMRLKYFGVPKILIWYLGMNDSDSDYQTYLTNVKKFCEDNNITLILNKVPSVPNRSKETIGGYVDSSGCRFIDSYNAVGANSSGVWYSGYLSSDNLHPTQLGAKALAMRAVIDVPELAGYGYDSVESTGNSSGDH